MRCGQGQLAAIGGRLRDCHLCQNFVFLNFFYRQKTGYSEKRAVCRETEYNQFLIFILLLPPDFRNIAV